MPRTCTICKHEKRGEIDTEMVNGSPYRSIAVQYQISKGALQRHREHIPGAMAMAKDALEVVRGDRILLEVLALKNKAISILKRAEAANELAIALRAIGEARSTLELLARMMDRLREAPTINLLTAPEWLRVRQRITMALQPFPDARTAVAQSLIELEAGSDGN